MRAINWLLRNIPLLLVALGGGFVQSASAQGSTFTQTLYANYHFHTLKNPTGISYLKWGIDGTNQTPSLIIADTGNSVIRSFNIKTGSLSTLAGNGTEGYSDNQLKYAEFFHPTGIDTIPIETFLNGSPHWDAAVYVGDSSNYVTRYFCVGSVIGTNALCPSTLDYVHTYAGNHVKDMSMDPQRPPNSLIWQAFTRL